MELPFPFYQKDGKTIIAIEYFPTSEKEKLFDIKFREVIRGTLSPSENAEPIFSGLHMHQVMQMLNSENKIVLAVSDSDRGASRLQKDLDLVFKIVTGTGLPFSFEFLEGEEQQRGMDLYYNISSAREVKLTVDLLKKAQDIFMALLSLDSHPNREKILMIRTILTLALSLEGGESKGLKCALFVTILESIYIGKDEEKITNKFSTRIAKASGQSFGSSDELIKIYGKRSRMYHSGVDEFSNEDLKSLEELSCWSLENFILDHNFVDDLVASMVS